MSTTIKNYATNSNSLLTFTSLVVKGAEGKVTFNAFLTSFNQAFTSQWNTETVYGRNDPIGNFQGTQRTLNLGWVIPAGTLDDAKDNLVAVSKLIRMLYPYYSTNEYKPTAAGQPVVGENALSLAKPPLMRLKYANLIQSVNSIAGESGLLGWVGNLSWTPDIEMGMFTDSTDKSLYPKVINLSVDFTVQHEHQLGSSPGRNSTASFPFGGE